MTSSFYKTIKENQQEGHKMLAILIDPEKFNPDSAAGFLQKIPPQTTHLFVGGSTVFNNETDRVVQSLKEKSALPVFLFPGDHSQIAGRADALLFLSLLSGSNPEYLIGQQLKSVSKIKNTSLEVIPTAYILIDGGTESAVARVTQTQPIPQTEIRKITHTALAGQYMGSALVYLEAGSGAKNPVSSEIIKSVKKAVHLPVIVGGGIKNEVQRMNAYRAGADMVVMGTAFENQK